MKISTCRSSLRSGSRNAWTRIKNVNGASCLNIIRNFFGTIQMISCRDWWPWMKPGYITMTWRQSNNQWSGGIAAHPAPENSKRKNLLEKFSPWFFGIKTASSSLIMFLKGQIINMEYYSSLSMQLKDILKEKRHRKVTKGVLFLHDNALAHWANATQKKLAYLGFQCLDHPPYSPILALSDYHLFPGLTKQLRGRHFLSNAEVIAATETWLDGNLFFFFFFFFLWLAKVRAMG